MSQCDVSNCALYEKVEQMERQAIEARKAASITHREMFERIRKLEDDRTEIKTHYEHIETEITGIRKSLDDIKNRSGKRWDGLVDKVLYLVVGAVVAYAMTRLGF